MILYATVLENIALMQPLIGLLSPLFNIPDKWSLAYSWIPSKMNSSLSMEVAHSIFGLHYENVLFTMSQKSLSL